MTKKVLLTKCKWVNYLKDFWKHTKSYPQLSRNEFILFNLQEQHYKKVAQILQKVFTCSFEKQLLVSSLVFCFLYLNSNGFYRDEILHMENFCCFLQSLDDWLRCVLACNHCWKRFYRQIIFFLITLLFPSTSRH